MMSKLPLYLAAVLSVASSTNYANTQVFLDRTLFLAASGSVDVTPSLSTLSAFGSTIIVDGIQISSPHGQPLDTLDRSSILPGNDIAVSGIEDFNVGLPAPVFSLGFDFHEPSGSPSTFTVAILSGATPLGSFFFDPPEDVRAFFGVWSDQAFNRLEIRETTAINQDEYLGHFYTGMAPVPIPAAIWLFLSGLATLGLRIQRNKRSA